VRPLQTLIPTTSSTSPEPVPSSSPPWSLYAIVKSSTEPPRRRSRPRLSPFTHHHLPRLEPVTPSIIQAPSQTCDAVPEPTTTSSSPSLRHCALDIIPEPAMSSTHTIPEPAAPSSSASLRRCHLRDVSDAIEHASSLSPQCHPPPQARKATLYIFLCHFEPTNPDFDMLHYHVALIFYIAFVLLHCFDVLHCHIIALICYIPFNMSHCFYFDVLHYF
jgi:hypothetical protein